jgi:hypothetical protein
VNNEEFSRKARAAGGQSRKDIKAVPTLRLSAFAQKHAFMSWNRVVVPEPE